MNALRIEPAITVDVVIVSLVLAATFVVLSGNRDLALELAAIAGFVAGISSILRLWTRALK